MYGKTGEGQEIRSKKWFTRSIRGTRARPTESFSKEKKMSKAGEFNKLHYEKIIMTSTTVDHGHVVRIITVDGIAWSKTFSLSRSLHSQLKAFFISMIRSKFSFIPEVDEIQPWRV